MDVLNELGYSLRYEINRTWDMTFAPTLSATLVSIYCTALAFIGIKLLFNYLHSLVEMGSRR